MKKAKRLLIAMAVLMLCLLMAAPVSAAVKISEKSITLIKGQTKTLQITGTKNRVKWSSNKKTVATVTSNGKVTAKNKGTATITAKVGKKKYTCKVKVETPKLSKSSMTLAQGKTATLKLSGTTQKATWASSNTKIATVTSTGTVKGVQPGSCVITATVGGKKYACSVTVQESGGKALFEGKEECGEGVFYIYFASGTSQNGTVPIVYVDKNYPFGFVDYCAYDVDNSVPIHVYIDGKQIDMDYVGYKIQRSFSFSGSEMNEGIHVVEMVQYKNNNTSGAVTTYRQARYKVIYK